MVHLRRNDKRRRQHTHHSGQRGRAQFSSVREGTRSGTESIGEREGGKPRTRASETEQGGRTSTTVQGAIHGTMNKAIRPAQLQAGHPEGLNGERGRTPPDRIIQSGGRRKNWSYARARGQEYGRRPQKKGVHERRQATEGPGQTERSRAARRRPCGPRGGGHTTPGLRGQSRKEELTGVPRGHKPKDWSVEGGKKVRYRTGPSSTCLGGKTNSGEGGRMAQVSGTTRCVRKQGRRRQWRWQAGDRRPSEHAGRVRKSAFPMLWGIL